MAIDEGSRSFATLIHSLEEGQLLVDLTNKLHGLNKVLSEHAAGTGKAKGELVLKIKLTADELGTVEIDNEIRVVEPKPRRSRSIMWLNKQNNLTAENPKQTKLALRELPRPEVARDIKEGSGE